MGHTVVDLRCPGCGATVTTGENLCKYCQRPIVISTFNSVCNMELSEVNKYANTYRQALVDNPNDFILNNSIGMCYLKLKLYDKAIDSFEIAIKDNFDNSELYFYAAISLLKGKKAFLTLRPEIDKIETYINTAIMIEPKGIYYYLLAYIKYDYFFRKHFRTTPTYQDALQLAIDTGVSAYDIEQFWSILGVQMPQPLQLFT